MQRGRRKLVRCILALAGLFAVQSAAPSAAEQVRLLLVLLSGGLGRDVKLARDEVVAKGIVINGLVILSDRPVPWNAEHTNPPGGLEKYYQDNVIGGPGAFVLVAENFNAFGRAIIKKLIAEIALLSGAPPRTLR